MKFYTGVGSRKTPRDILQVMVHIAMRLAGKGYCLRSGGAEGADQAFAYGAHKADGHKHIFFAKDATPEAMEIAKKYHPAWDRCSDYAKKLHGRNAFQVLGRELDTPSEFLICWTQDACIHHNTRSFDTGGTGTAISIASMNGVKITNLANPESLDEIKLWLYKVS